MNRRIVGVALRFAIVSGALWGCAGDASDATPAGVQVRDSAGIRIVENQANPEHIPVYAEVGEMEVSIGAVDGDPAYAFGDVSAARAVPSGGYLVADRQAREVRLFDERGDYVRTLEGPGDGPGEIANLSSVTGVTSDSVWVWDRRSSRVTAFPLDGGVPVAVYVEMQPDGRVADIERLSDGGFVASSARYDVRVARGRRPRRAARCCCGSWTREANGSTRSRDSWTRT